ncbi:MAG: DUF3307 domain-containing protein [Patescibacteria group bacterium]
MTLFLLFTLAHLLGDYPFQTSWIYLQKTKGLPGQLLHVSILGACFLILTAPLLSNRIVLNALTLILVMHFLQDFLKIELVSKRGKIRPFPALVLDQALHFALLFGVTNRLNSVNLKIGFGADLLGSPSLPWILFYLATLILGTFTWDVVRFVWRNETKELQHDWLALGLRGAIITIIFGAVYLLDC